MDRFLTNYKKRPSSSNPENEKSEKRKKYESEKRKRGFIPSWKLAYKWLEYDSPDTGMTCTICREFDKMGTFVTGCKNYKRDSINQHEKSEGHKLNVIKFNNKKNPEKSEGAKALVAMNQLTVSRLVYKFRNVYALSKKARPFTDYPMLCDLDQSKGLDIGTQYRTDKKAAEFASYIATAEQNRIRNRLREAKFISAISDGTTDSSFQETEIVFVRHSYHGEITVNFSLVKNIPKADADSISKVIIAGMENLDENFRSKLVAIGTDGASVMLGSKTGAVKRIKEFCSRQWIVAVHCSGHKLELAFKDTVKKKITLYDRISSFLLNIYYFYRNSNLNRSILKDSFKVLGEQVILPTRVGGTRWMSHLKTAIQCYLRGFNAIYQHLMQLQNPDDRIYSSEKANKAKCFLKLMQSKSAWLMVNFLMDILVVLVEVSKQFQERTTSITRILSQIDIAIYQIEKLQTSDGPFLRKAKENIPEFLKGDLRMFDAARKGFCDGILKSLTARFVDNPGIMKACGVFDLKQLPNTTEELKDYGDDYIAELVDYFHSALQEAGVESELIELEWSSLKQSILSRIKDPSHSTWKEVYDKFSDVCPNLLSLVDLVLTIPASSADAERGFNRLKMAKTDWRSKMTDTHLSEQMTVMLEGPDILSFDPLPAISLFLQTPRRNREKEPKPLIKPNINEPISDSEQEIQNEELEQEVLHATGRVNKLLDILADRLNEEYESDDDYIEEHTKCNNDDIPYEDFEHRITHQSQAFQKLCELMEVDND